MKKKATKIKPNCNLNIKSGNLCIQTLGETFEINIKPGKYKMYEIFDEGFKINKEKELKEVEEDEK